MRIRSVGARLSLALALVVAGALGVVWIALVPTLHRNLVSLVGSRDLLLRSAQRRFGAREALGKKRAVSTPLWMRAI